MSRVFPVGFNASQLSVGPYKMPIITNGNILLPTPSVHVYRFSLNPPRKPPALCYHGFMPLVAAKAGEAKVHLPPAFTAAPLGTTFNSSRR